MSDAIIAPHLPSFSANSRMAQNGKPRRGTRNEHPLKSTCYNTFLVEGFALGELPITITTLLSRRL